MIEWVHTTMARLKRKRRSNIERLPGGYTVEVSQGPETRQVLTNGFVTEDVAKMIKRLYVEHQIVVPACTVHVGDHVQKTDYSRLKEFVTMYGDVRGVNKYMEWANDPFDGGDE